MKGNTLELILKIIKKGDGLKETASDFKALQIQASKLNKAYQVLGMKGLSQVKREAQLVQAAFNRLKRAKKENKISSLELYKAEVNLREKLRALKQETNGWANTLGRAKAGLLGIASAGYLVARAENAYAEFAHKMQEVNTLLNVSSEEFKKIQDGILQVSTQFPQSVTDLTGSAYDFISAGAKVGDVLKSIKLASKAAVAGITDTKTATKVGMAVINAYGKSISELSSVYDELFMTVKLGVTTFPELAQHIGEVLPTARMAGVSFKEVGAAIATLTKAGIRTPLAVTALNSALRNLAMPSEQTKKAMHELGIEWKGLVPTLKQLIKYADNPEILGKIIPDADARKALFTLIQNYKEFNFTLDQFANSAGATEEAYNKMKNTPINQIKLLKNNIHALMIKLGEFASKGLLPITDALLSFIRGVESADPATKTFITILTSVGASFALWKMGLGDIVLGLKGAIVSFREATASMQSFKTATLATKAALVGGIVVSVVYTGYEIGRLIKQMWTLRQEIKGFEEDAEKYKIAATKYKDASDVQILSKEKLLSLSKEEKEAYKQNLIEALRYYSNLYSAAKIMSTDAMLGGLLPYQSQKGKENEKKAREYWRIVSNIMQALIALGGEAKHSAEEIAKSGARYVYVMQIASMNVKEFKAEVQRAYNTAIEKAREYADRVKEYEALIRNEHITTEDLIRNLKRKTMDEASAWEDKRLEAEEKISKAREALEKGNFELAKKLTGQAKDLYASLAQQVVEKTKDGQTVVVKTLDETTDVAVAGIKDASQLMEKILSIQKQNALNMQKQYEEKARQVKKVLDQLTVSGTKNITIELKNLDKVRQILEDLSVPVTKYVKIVPKKISSPEPSVEKRQAGGKIPGYGGGDIVPAFLEPGEFVVRKEAVKKYFPLLRAINEFKLPGFQNGGLVQDPKLLFKKIGEKELVFPNYWGAFHVNILGDFFDEKSKLLTRLNSLYHSFGIFVPRRFNADFRMWWIKKRKEFIQKLFPDIGGADGRKALGRQISKNSDTSEAIRLDFNLGNKTFPAIMGRELVKDFLNQLQLLKGVSI